MHLVHLRHVTNDQLIGLNYAKNICLRQSTCTMTEAQESSKKYRLYAIISLIATVLLLVFVSEFFWLGLPFLLTFTVKAFGAM